jgi:hypothetical protein
VCVGKKRCVVSGRRQCKCDGSECVRTEPRMKARSPWGCHKSRWSGPEKARQSWPGDEVGGDGRIKAAGVEKVKGNFGVRKKAVPEVVGEVGMSVTALSAGLVL